MFLGHANIVRIICQSGPQEGALRRLSFSHPCGSYMSFSSRMRKGFMETDEFERG